MKGHQHTRIHSKPYFDLDVGLANSSHHHHSRSNSSSTTTLTSSLPVTTSLINFNNPLRLAPPPEPTRVQLQRQRLQEQQHANTPVSKAIPAFKTSAAFFTSLRHNLASPPPSPLSTPPSMRGSTTSLPPPSPLSFPATTPMDDDESIPSIPPVSDDHDPLAGVPELTTALTTDEIDRTEALKLIADSVAQQRQIANRILLSNPLNLSLLVLALALILRYMRANNYDLYLQLMTPIGLLMSFMAITRYLTQNYLFAAEEINWDWVGESEMLVTKFGEEVIGCCVLGWRSGEKGSGKRRKVWKGEVRAWTVRMKYRGKGVGGALLEAAVGEARRKGAEGLEFEGGHANSKRVLPAFYNGYFEKRERQARELLEGLMQSSPAGRGGGKRK